MTTTAATEAPAKKADGAVKVVGILVLIAGIVMIVAGAFTWASVSSHLKAENITVSEDAANYAGKQVAGPLTAYAEAEVIQKHALEATGGKTYAELDREDAMTASFLRASLFSSVIAFGVAAMAIGLGVVNILLGWSLTRLAKR